MSDFCELSFLISKQLNLRPMPVVQCHAAHACTVYERTLYAHALRNASRIHPNAIENYVSTPRVHVLQCPILKSCPSTGHYSLFLFITSSDVQYAF